MTAGSLVTLTLQAKDAEGNNLTTGTLAVAFSFSYSGGGSTGRISPTTDHGNGTYTATFEADRAGTATTIGATIGTTDVTSSLPTVTVTPGPVSIGESGVSVSTRR